MFHFYKLFPLPGIKAKANRNSQKKQQSPVPRVIQLQGRRERPEFHSSQGHCHAPFELSRKRLEVSKKFLYVPRRILLLQFHLEERDIHLVSIFILYPPSMTIFKFRTSKVLETFWRSDSSHILVLAKTLSVRVCRDLSALLGEPSPNYF